MDLSDTITPKSDQMNADDLLTGPRTFTITDVRKTNGEQPVSIYLAEFPDGRPFKPSKSMRRVLIALWGKESVGWIGRRLTLFRDPHVLWAGQEVGGIRISHVSHIAGRQSLALTVAQSKRERYVIEPLLEDAPTSPAVSAETLAELTVLFERKGIPEEQRLSGVNHLTGGSATALEVITEDQARLVIAQLVERADVEAADQ